VATPTGISVSSQAPKTERVGAGSRLAKPIAQRRPEGDLDAMACWWRAAAPLLTASEVAGVLRKELSAHGSRKRGTKERLVRFDLGHSTVRPVVQWGSGAVSPQAIYWREFWTTLEQCGRVAWPQLIRLPARITQPRERYPRPQVIEKLRAAGVMLTERQWNEAEPLVTLEPDEDGNYQIAPVSRDRVSDLHLCWWGYVDLNHGPLPYQGNLASFRCVCSSLRESNGEPSSCVDALGRSR
jgi:hypothetical protein